MFHTLKNNTEFSQRLRDRYIAFMHIKLTEVELFAKGEMMKGAKMELKQELKKLAEDWKDQVKIIPDDELAKFVKRDYVMAKLRENGVRAKIDVQRSGSS